MKILSVNAGSSSLKFALFEFPGEKNLINGYFEKIGLGNSFYTIKIDDKKIKREVDLKSHGEAISYLKEELISNKIIDSLDEIDAVGHRIVHGGSFFGESTVIDEEVLSRVESFNELAPLHNPANVVGIKAFREYLPYVPMVGVFDTAFHQSMAPEQYMYPVPYEWYEEFGVRKYGFHGTSHKFIDKTISEYLKKDNLKVISCHIGSGASVCAIDTHRVVDTSMGFTPLAGVMMGTRCGDIDAGIIPYIMTKTDKNIDEVMDILNKKSGFIGVSGVSNDARDIEAGAEKGNERCQLVIDINARRIANYIAMYNNILNGADVICFTAGLGEKSPITRAEVIKRISSLGINLDSEGNENAFGKFGLISTKDSKIPVYVVPTDEELMIALDTYNAIN